MSAWWPWIILYLLAVGVLVHALALFLFLVVIARAAATICRAVLRRTIPAGSRREPLAPMPAPR
ncbi:hypothetical protein [Streptomyces sp. NPDC005953]|uniref:hypothetical protein n=1 Tax=Streptomyces sp. NPDC005953 TaxID=3156719 RepID=UPI0033DF8F8F